MSSTPAADPVPVRSPSRAAEQAGFILAAVLLVALALPAANRLATTGLPRWLAVAAIALAVLTVVAGVGAVVLAGAGGRRRLQALLVMASGVSLLAATALAGSAAVAVLAGGPPPAKVAAEGLTVVISGVGEATLLTMRAELPDVAAGDLVRAEVTADVGGSSTVLARQLTVAAGAGPVSMTLASPAAGDYDTVRVLVESPDRRCTASLRPQVSEAPVASCKDR